MKLYVSHASNPDYVHELYEPLKAAFSTNYELILPHEVHVEGYDTKTVIPACEMVLAEVSHASTGQGIELGWASAANVRIIGFYKAGAAPSSAVRFITSELFEYVSPADMITTLKNYVAA